MLLLAASTMAKADANTTWQCLQDKCILTYDACSLVPMCGAAIKCMKACSDKACESNCMVDAAEKAKKYVAASAALVSLDLCGGYSDCFEYGKVLAMGEAKVGGAKADCDGLDEPTGGDPEWHCDPAGNGEAVMCISKTLTQYSANRCCDSEWLYTDQGSLTRHGFTLEQAKTWSAKCDKENCCENLSGMQCYQKQLTELGHISVCGSTLLV